MSVIAIHRLRLPNGQAVEKPEDFQDYIVELLKQRPYTPSELARALQKSTKQIHRYLNALKEKNKIEKIEGSDSYKLRNSSDSRATLQEMKLFETLAEFNSCESIKNWKSNNNAKRLDDKLVWFSRLCTGKIIPNFKLNPDFYDTEETTKLIVSKLKEIRGLSNSEMLPQHIRQTLRSFIIYGKNETLSTAKGERLGLSGEKASPSIATLHMKPEQYNKTVMLIREGIEVNVVVGNMQVSKVDRQTYLKFIFRYWTFCRPSSMYIVKCDDLEFYDRTVKYIEINGEKISDKKVIQALGDKYEIKEYTHRACTVEILENKTDVAYTKYIFDDQGVKELEIYTKERIANGFKYLFWDDNKTNFTKADYDTIVTHKRNLDNQVFKEIFLKVGFKEGDFGKNMRANYALRHFGVQRWLDMTDYDYGFVSEMGWEDINTLRLWYGRRTAQALQKKISEVLI